MYRNQFLRRSFRTGGADRGACDADSCQDPGRGGGIVGSEPSGSAVDRDLLVMLTVDTLGRSAGWASLPAAGAPRGREASDALTAVSNDSVEAEESTSVLLPMLGVLALGIECSG